MFNKSMIIKGPLKLKSSKKRNN